MGSLVAQAEKEKVVGSIKQKINESQVIIFADFRGLSVSDLTSLRRSVRKEGGSAAVYKNTLTRRALEELNITCPGHFLEGPSLVLNAQDPVNMAKILVKFGKEVNQFSIKGGLLEGVVLTEKSVMTLATLPSRDQLIAQVVGTVKAPLTRLVTSLSSPVRGLVNSLNAIKEKKQEVK